MAKEAGNTTPDYSLDSGTLAAVAKAGVSGGTIKQGKRAARKGKAPVSARQALDKASVAGAAAKGTREIGEAHNEARDLKKAEVEKKKKEDQIKQDKIDDADIKWEDVFAKMKDGGEWASADLYADFQADEEGYKKVYLGFLEQDPPDRKAAAKALREQGERSSQLKSWKETMERSLKMSTDYDMSKIVTGDTPAAVKNRGILASLANAGGKGASMVSEDGVMKFEVEHLDENGDMVKATVTQKEVDKMMTAAVSPVIRKQMHKKQNDLYVANATDGLPFDPKAALASTTENVAVELRKNPESAHSILHDPVSGDQSLADYLTEAIKATPTKGKEGEFVQDGINFTINMPDASDLPSHPDGDDGSWDVDGVPGLSLAEIQAMQSGKAKTKEELAATDLSADDIENLMKDLEADPKLLAEVAGGFMAMRYENAHKEEATRVQEVGFEKALKQARSPGVGTHNTRARKPRC